MRLLLIFLFLCSHSALSKVFDTDPQVLETINLPDGYKRVNYSKRYSLAIPDELKTERLSPGSRFFLITTSNGKNGKAVFSVDEIPTLNTQIFRPENYGLNGSRRELLSAIYDKHYGGNNDVSETRNTIFQQSKDVQVYLRDGFMFFRSDIDYLRMKVELTVSTPVNDDVLSISFFVDDEELIMNVIQSLKVN